jgi:alpha-tubulin suppressor-like RCC1 family protein
MTTARTLAVGAAALLVATACGDGNVTSVRIDLDYDTAWELTELDLRVDVKSERVAVRPELRVLLPDDWAGRSVTVEVLGLRGDDTFARGTAEMVPVRGEEVAVEIRLEPLPCGDWCTPGATRCDGDGVATCARGADGCNAWSEAEVCAGETPYCSLGACMAECVPECADGDSACDGPYASVACGQGDSDSCLDWLVPVACADGQTCASGTCAAECTDACEDGAVACSGPGVITCDDANADGCSEWSAVVPCEDGLSCSAGECTDECTDECAESVCEGLSHRPCGQYDGDECLDLGPAEGCTTDDECTEAACVPDEGCTTAPSGECSAGIRLALGAFHSCAITEVGAPSCWGQNDTGQLGDATTTNRLVATPPFGIPGGVRTMSAGFTHTCAVTDAGDALCWGNGFNGELGTGTTTSTSVPIEVSVVSEPVIGIALGSNTTCVVVTGGGVHCWGGGGLGQLGNGAFNDSLTAVPVTGLASGALELAGSDGEHTCARLSSGVRCWGANNTGQLGDGTTIPRSTPVEVSGLPRGIVGIELGFEFGCAVTDDGEAWCWGSNSGGQLGDGTTTFRPTPVRVMGLPAAVSEIATGQSHTCARLVDGEAVCWGSGADGQLGTGATSSSLTPVPVLAPAAVTRIAAGDRHTCAAFADGEVRCWGLNTSGQLGDGSTTNRNTPVEVVGFESAAP